MAEPKTILAMAVGPKRDVPIRDRSNLSGVRPYVHGLVEGLDRLGHQLGTHYVIEYRERDVKDLDAAAFKVSSVPPGDLLIFCMSTTVVRAAADKTDDIPILGVVSDPQTEGFDSAVHVCSVSGRRIETAGTCLERFVETVPTLKEVRALHKPGYGPSDRALKLVKEAAAKKGVAVTEVHVSSRDDIKSKLEAMDKRDLNKPADVGILVLPVDVCLGAASMIIDLAQGQKNLPVFFPVPDWVKSQPPSALGGYGVAQHTCGLLSAQCVNEILWHARKPAAMHDHRFMAAPDDALQWVVSNAAAAALNIKLDSKIRAI